MRAVLSTLSFDPRGVVAIEALPTSGEGESRRRMNRVATLDGGAVINDFGYSEADRIVELRWRSAGHDHDRSVERLLKLYARLRLATRNGCYVVAPQSYQPGPTESNMSLLVVEKLTED